MIDWVKCKHGADASLGHYVIGSVIPGEKDGWYDIRFLLPGMVDFSIKASLAKARGEFARYVADWLRSVTGEFVKGRCLGAKKVREPSETTDPTAA